MKVYGFRVFLEHDDEEIFRDIELTSDHGFEDFHNAVQDSFGFDKSQMASFYLCDDNWKKITEVTLLDMKPDESGVCEETILMKDMKLSECVTGEGQKLIYVFDFLNLWTFYIELHTIKNANAGVKYPVCTKKSGKNPQQYSKGMIDEFDEAAIAAAMKDPASLLEEDEGMIGGDYSGYDDEQY